MGSELTLTGAFIIGLLHVLEPCEDKAVASLYATALGQNTKRVLFLVFLYGLGMMIADTFLGLLFGFIGAHYLAGISAQLELVAEALTVAFGLMVFAHTHKLESHCYAKGFSGMKSDSLSMLIFGIVRGLPPCPIEMAILVMAASTGSVLKGGLLVAVFGLGTLISLLPFGLAIGGILTLIRKRFGENASRMIPKLSGIVISLIGLVMLIRNILGSH
jgi:sulfite exporter TauE/SafE